MVESDVLALGTANTILSGKQYNRCARSHKLMYEALQRLRFKSFYNSLDEEAKSNLLCVTDTICSHVQDGKDMTDIPDELTNIIDAYLAFVDVSCSDNPTYNFWSGYIDMVQLMLLHIRATRTSDWDLHLQTVRLMMPWFFVTDRVNYSRSSDRVNCLKCPSRGSQQYLKMSVQGVNNVSNVRPGGLNNISKCPSRGSTMSQMSVQGVSTIFQNVRPGDQQCLKCPSRGSTMSQMSVQGVSTMSQNVRPGGLYDLSGDQMKKSKGEKFWESN